MAVPNLLVTRRSLLLGAAGLAGGGALLAACGGDEPEFVVVQRFPNDRAFVAGDVRLPVSLATADASLLTEGPDRLTGKVRTLDGEVIGSVDAKRRGTGLSVPYWSIETTLPTAGSYEFTIDGAIGDPTPVLVFDASEITIPVVGAKLPGFDTPTTADARGVDPVCTRLSGACPFHELTLNEALQKKQPIVYIVGTPAHCATATCGPGLDFLIEAAPAYAGRVNFVHAEIYADPAGTQVAPAVEALTLSYEPVMFFTDAAGVVTNRVDIVWDAADLKDLLAAAFD